MWQVLGVEKLDGDVDEIGPLLGKVDVQHLLQRNAQLWADVGLGRAGEDGNQTRANRRLFALGDGVGRGGDAVGLAPTFVDAVFKVDGRWEGECVSVDITGINKAGYVSIIRTRESQSAILLGLEDVQQSIEEARRVLRLNAAHQVSPSSI